MPAKNGQRNYCGLENICKQSKIQIKGTVPGFSGERNLLMTCFIFHGPSVWERIKPLVSTRGFYFLQGKYYQVKPRGYFNQLKVMDQEVDHISRPVKVYFKKNRVAISGRLIFKISKHDNWFFDRIRSLIILRTGDNENTDAAYSLYEISMILYL